MTRLETWCEKLRGDRAMEETEKLEASYKHILKQMAAADDSDFAYQAAVAQKRIGFILKYKSYGIKASTPLGFSLFFLEPEQGFSFQRHVNTKTEHFHFLSVPQGRNFAYLCESDEWKKFYESEKFTRWLAGEPNPAFERYCYLPQPGDILSVDRPGVVHTALGCVLEEYANVSTDMVDRLHDQNKGKTIPQKFNRPYFLKQLDAVKYPQDSRRVLRTEKGFAVQPLPWTSMGDAKRLLVASTQTYTAERLFLPPGASWVWKTGDQFLTAFLSEGTVLCQLIRYRDAKMEKSLSLDRHDIFLILPRTEWRVQNLSPKSAQFSVLSINEAAFNV